MVHFWGSPTSLVASDASGPAGPAKLMDRADRKRFLQAGRPGLPIGQGRGRGGAWPIQIRRRFKLYGSMFCLNTTAKHRTECFEPRFLPSVDVNWKSS